MSLFKFAPARKGEMTVYGATRPGHPSQTVDLGKVQEWISFMKNKGIWRVCCLLPPKQLKYYQADLLDEYKGAFGELNVCAAQIEDYHLCDQATLEDKIMPFLLISDRTTAPVVVHCSGGSGRTGHVLAAWLVRHRGVSVDEAIKAVLDSGRNPCEAVRCGNATEKELRDLLKGNNPGG